MVFLLYFNFNFLKKRKLLGRNLYWKSKKKKKFKTTSQTSLSLCLILNANHIMFCSQFFFNIIYCVHKKQFTKMMYLYFAFLGFVESLFINTSVWFQVSKPFFINFVNSRKLSIPDVLLRWEFLWSFSGFTICQKPRAKSISSDDDWRISWNIF